jgi:hypothetical protein
MRKTHVPSTNSAGMLVLAGLWTWRKSAALAGILPMRELAHLIH